MDEPVPVRRGRRRAVAELEQRNQGGMLCQHRRAGADPAQVQGVGDDAAAGSGRQPGGQREGVHGLVGDGFQRRDNAKVRAVPGHLAQDVCQPAMIGQSGGDCEAVGAQRLSGFHHFQPRCALVSAFEQQELDVLDPDPGLGHRPQRLGKHRRTGLQVVGPFPAGDRADPGTDEVEACGRGDAHQLRRRGVEKGELGQSNLPDVLRHVLAQILAVGTWAGNGAKRTGSPVRADV